jgi:uncharacterized membrane protein HdeD (DUF308 family)
MADERTKLDVVRETRSLAYGLGALTLAAGLVLLFWPDRTITVIARLTGLLMAITGVADLLDTLRNHRSGSYWGLLAVRGVINLAFGAALLFWPGPTVQVLVWLVGFDLVLGGILGLVVRGRMPAELRGPILTRSLVTIAFGAAIMIWPDVTANVLALLVGATLAFVGLVLLWSGRQVSKATIEV